jgi:hypothetical protein
MNVRLDGDGCWPDLVEKNRQGKLIDLMNGESPIQFALLRKGMASGKSSVTLRLDLPDGRTVLSQTSMALFEQGAKILLIGDDRTSGPELRLDEQQAVALALALLAVHLPKYTVFLEQLAAKMGPAAAAQFPVMVTTYPDGRPTSEEDIQWDRGG